MFGEVDTALNHNYYPAGNYGAEISESDYKLACNTSTYNNTSTHTLEYELSAGEHFIDVKYSKDDASDANSDTLQFKVAITLDEPYSPTPYYAYDISNIQENHVIVVKNADSTKLFVKLNGTWTEVDKAYKKVNGSWTEVSIDTAFETGVNYVHGN